MKYAFPVPCQQCGEIFLVNVNGEDIPDYAHCPACEASIYLIAPLGNVVGMAILARASSEFKGKDWTLTIVLSAMAVECQLAWLFTKWNRIMLGLQRNPTDADEEAWENEWRDIRVIAKRMEKVSNLLTQKSFDEFIAQNNSLVKSINAKYTNTSHKEFFVKELFHRRNRIVHAGKIDSQMSEAEIALAVATTMWQILDAMDKARAKALDASFHKPAKVNSTSVASG
jgi:hypothetical protein